MPPCDQDESHTRYSIKALYSQSFRTPNIGVANNSPIPLKDEFTTTYELEAGVRLGGGLSLTGNAYHVRIENLIAYEGSVNRYVNGAPMSTEGVELQARFQSERIAAYLGYSYNRAVDQGLALFSAEPALGHLNLNMPAHQIVWNATWHITRALDWNASGTFLSRRAAYAYPDPAAPSILDGEVLLHSHLRYQWHQLDLGVGVRDLLDRKEVIGQPYNGGTGPLRLSGRTFFAQVGFRFRGDR